MSQPGLHCCPSKNTNSSSPATPQPPCNPSQEPQSQPHAHHHHECCCLSKLVQKLRKRSKVMLRSSSFSTASLLNHNNLSRTQCRYDPLSYSLNFDTSSECGNLLDEEDYYRFCAFSSRFVAPPAQTRAPGPGAAPCSRLVLSASSH